MTPFRRRRPWSERGTPGGSASLRSPHIRNCRAEATARGCTRTTRETCGNSCFQACSVCRPLGTRAEVSAVGVCVHVNLYAEVAFLDAGQHEGQRRLAV